MVVELIAKNKKEKFEFEGRCKLKIDCLSKLLLVEPINEEYKMISAVFSWQFIAEKNILFVFAEHDFQDFALIFDNANKCKKVYNHLLKKEATSGNKELIPQRFLPSLFTKISEGYLTTLKFKQILTTFFNYCDRKEKEDITQLLKNYNIFDMIYPMEDEKRKRKRKPKVTTPSIRKKAVEQPEANKEITASVSPSTNVKSANQKGRRGGYQVGGGRPPKPQKQIAGYGYVTGRPIRHCGGNQFENVVRIPFKFKYGKNDGAIIKVVKVRNEHILRFHDQKGDRAACAECHVKYRYSAKHFYDNVFINHKKSTCLGDMLELKKQQTTWKFLHSIFDSEELKLLQRGILLQKFKELYETKFGIGSFDNDYDKERKGYILRKISKTKKQKPKNAEILASIDETTDEEDVSSTNE